MRCGPLTLRYIAKRVFEKELTDEEADKLCLLSNDGTSPSGMRNGMQQIGLTRVEILRNTSLDILEHYLSRGYVVVVDYLDGGGKYDGHWSSLHHSDVDNVVLYDPDCGTRVMPRDHFDVTWYDYEIVNGEWILWEKTAVVGKNGGKPIH